MFELNNLKNEAILRDLFIFQTETSSIFAFDNIKIKAILRDVLQKWKVECSADSLVPMRFAIFPVHLSKVLRLPGKIDARSYEVLHLSRKIILANLHIWYSKMQPLSRNQRPDLLTSLMNRHLNFQKWSDHGVFCTFWLRNVLRATTPCTFSSSQLPKLLWTPQFLTHFTSKCASRHNAVHVFNISTSKSGPILRCFVPFHFEIGFAPQRRATVHLLSPQMSPHLPL